MLIDTECNATTVVDNSPLGRDVLPNLVAAIKQQLSLGSKLPAHLPSLVTHEHLHRPAWHSTFESLSQILCLQPCCSPVRLLFVSALRFASILCVAHACQGLVRQPDRLPGSIKTPDRSNCRSNCNGCSRCTRKALSSAIHPRGGGGGAVTFKIPEGVADSYRPQAVWQ